MSRGGVRGDRKGPEQRALTRLAVIRRRWPVAAVTVAALLLALPAARATFPGENGLIVYAAPGANGQAQIWTVASNGQDRHELTDFSEGGAAQPTWSPDGSRIAFVTPDGHIAVMNADGSGQTDLTPNDAPGGVVDASPAFSPDGDLIAFDRINYDAATPKQDVWVMNADGSDPRDLTSAASEDSKEATWAPSGSTIAFVRGDPEEIWTMTGTGADQAQLSQSDFDASDPSWSADASRLAYSYEDGTDLFLVNRDGSGESRLTDSSSTGVDLGEPSWSPDDSRIVAAGVNTSSGATALYLVDPTSGTPTVIPNTSGGTDPDWQPLPSSQTSTTQTSTTQTSTTQTSPPPPSQTTAGSPPVTVTLAASSLNSLEGSIAAAVSHGPGSCSTTSNATVVCRVTAASTISLAAMPRPDFDFTHWAGACAGAHFLCQLSGLTASATTIAGFAPHPIQTVGLLHSLMAVSGHDLARLCTTLTACGTITRAAIGTCAASIGGNPDLNLVAVNGCLKYAGSTTDSSGNHLFQFTSSGPIDADDVTFSPTSGALTVSMYSDANQLQHFSIGGDPDVQFAGLDLGRESSWNFDPVHPAGSARHFYSSEWSTGGAFAQGDLPIPSGQHVSVFSVLSITPPSFAAGAGDASVRLQAPAALGDATSPPVDLSSAIEQSIRSQSVPSYDDGGNPTVAANGCGTGLSAPLPATDVATFAFPSLSLDGFAFTGRAIATDAPAAALFEGRFSTPSTLNGGSALEGMIELSEPAATVSTPVLSFACAELEGAQPVVPEIDATIRRFDVGIVTTPQAQVAGGGEMTIGTQMPFGSHPYPIDMSGNWSVTLPPWGTSGPWNVHDDGNIDFLGSGDVSGTADFSSVGYASADVDWTGINLPFGLNVGAGDFSGRFDAGNGWELSAATGISWQDISLTDAYVVVSDLGIGGCGTIFGESASLSATWQGEVTPAIGSCDAITPVEPSLRVSCFSLRQQIADPNTFAPVKTADQQLLSAGDCVETGQTSAVRATRQAQAHAASGVPAGFASRITPGRSSVTFVLHGSTGAPVADVAGPGHVECGAGAPAGASREGACVDLAPAGSRTTLITVMRPAAGAWVVALAPGSAPLVSDGVQYGLPAPHLKVRVVRTRAGGYAIRYRDAPTDGETVTLTEQGTQSGEILGRTRGAAGTIGFAPSPGPAGIRHIVAEMGQHGIITRRVTVATYRAAAPTLPAPRLRVRTSGARAQISFSRVPGAVAYLVTQTGTDRRRTITRVTSRSLSLRAQIPGRARVIVTVAGVDRFGYSGRRRATRVTLTLPPPALILPRYHGRKPRRHTARN